MMIYNKHEGCDLAVVFHARPGQAQLPHHRSAKNIFFIPLDVIGWKVGYNKHGGCDLGVLLYARSGLRSRSALSFRMVFLIPLHMEERIGMYNKP